jgi:K+-transporting ATPase KdpF subunit
MDTVYLIALITAVAVFIYLVAVLFYPEDFS